jgi:hypothetical protein
MQTDRQARSTADLLTIEADLARSGVALVVPSMGLDTRGNGRRAGLCGALGDRQHPDPHLQAQWLAWLTDVLQRIISGRNTIHQLNALLPWNWRPPATASTV